MQTILFKKKNKTKRHALSNKIILLSLPFFLLMSCSGSSKLLNTYHESISSWNEDNELSDAYSEETHSSSHQHIYSEGWACDEIIHWHPDLCGHDTRIDVGEHNFGEWITDSVQNDNNIIIKHKMCSVCGYTENVLPTYYHTENYLVNRIDSINNHCALENGMTFSFITDLHLLHNSQSSKELMKVVLDNTPASFVVCGGDIVSAFCNDNDSAEESCNSQLETWNSWLDYWSPARVFQVRGNHDFIVNNHQMETYYKKTEKDTYLSLLSRNEDVINYNTSLGLCYSYDCSINKIRFLFIDDYTVSSTQPNMLLKGFASDRMEWLIDVLDCSDDYHLIVVSHETCDDTMSEYSSSMEAVHNILSSYKNKQVFEGEYNGLHWHHDFRESKGKLICVLNGHSHKDESHVKNNVLSISTMCDTPYNDDKEARIRDSISESAFDVFNIDLGKKTINATRIGAGKDRFWEYA